MRDSYTKNKQRPTKSRGFVPAVALVVGLLTVTGCNSPGGTVDPTGTATAQATATESVTPLPPPTTVAPVYKPATDQGPAENVPVPVLPAKAKEFSKEGLIAFTEYWYSTLGYAFETGDPELMMAVSDPGCRTCKAMEKTVVAGHSEGKWIVGGKMIIDPPNSTFEQVADGSYQALTMARQDHVKYLKADGTLSKDLGVTIAEMDILVGIYRDNSWVAMTVEHVAGSKAS